MVFAKPLRWIAISVCSLVVIASTVATLISFPWNTDPQGDESSSGSVRDFYKKVYNNGEASKGSGAASEIAPLSAKEQYYVNVARQSAIKTGIPRLIDNFVSKYGLKDKKVLEVGAGSGLLQDAVADYTALDISPSARRFFHKPFVEASATAMPFPDNTFDVLWSVWVLEHIPNPEKALLEIRRVVKPGGYLFLDPAVDISPYASQGYDVRPYHDFDWKGRLIKATAPFTKSQAYHALQYHQTRALRSLAAHLSGGPSRLHFVQLTPNYDQYWEPDSDATTSMSMDELYLWFTTRGDRCMNCPPAWKMALRDVGPEGLIVRLSK